MDVDAVECDVGNIEQDGRFRFVLALVFAPIGMLIAPPTKGR